MKKLALLGGTPIFRDRIDVVRPLLYPNKMAFSKISEVLKNGKITNNSKYVREFEAALKDYFKVKYCVAVCNGTIGLILALKSLEMKGEVIVPSFTFSATVHAIMWNNMKPVFVDIERDTFTMDPDKVRAAITSRTRAILAVHVFGNACKIYELEKIAFQHNIKLIFDSAHAFGSKYDNKQISSFGEIEIFSLHATKIFGVGEGGLITTNNKDIGEYCSMARSFGNPGDDDCRFWGLNGKMTEIFAILGLSNLRKIDVYIKVRQDVVKLYLSLLKDIPGIYFQKITERCKSNYQNFAILINEKEFGLDRDALHQVFQSENITTKKYFYPAMHMHTAYKEYYKKYHTKLPVTNYVSKNILCLPIYSDMKEIEVKKVCDVLYAAYKSSDQIRKDLDKR